MNGRRLKQLKRNIGVNGAKITAEYQDKVVQLTRSKVLQMQARTGHAPAHNVQVIMLHGTRKRLKDTKAWYKAQARAGIRAITRTEGLQPKQMYSHAGKKKSIVSSNTPLPVDHYQV